MIDNFYTCFFRISKLLNKYLDDKLAPIGLNNHHKIFIRKIVENPGIARDSFKKFSFLHPSNITRTIDELEENSFITKQINEEDKRITFLYPTKKLEEAYLILEKAIEEWKNIITEGLTDKEKEDYRRFLNLSTELSVKHFKDK